MNFNLRKGHRIIWGALILIVPTLIVLTVLSIKEPLLTDSDLNASLIDSSEQALFEDDNFSISLEHFETKQELRIIVKRSLKRASAEVYGITSEGNIETQLGTLNRRGEYSFSIEDPCKQIRIYDAIKDQDIIKIEL